MNSIVQALRATCVAALFVVLMSSNSWADPWNKKTVITINNSMQIPGAVLHPGKYVFKLADSPSNRHIVQVFNEDESNIIATVLAIPNHRLKPTGDSEFGFWEAPANNPQPLRSWFYPGDNFGQEFAYQKREAVLIAATAKEEVPTVTEEQQVQLAQAAPAPEPPPAQPETPRAVEQQPPAPAPAERQPAAVEPARIEEPRPAAPPAALPRTASALPFVGLVGLISLGLAFVLRMIRTLS
jgi:hypothetical protein